MDDDHDVQKLIVELLSQEYQVHSALTVQDALELWATHDIALVITEKTLPDGNGSQLAKHGAEHQPGTRLIVMSAEASSTWVVGAMYRNVVDYLVKPIRNEEEVRLRVARALSLSEATQPCATEEVEPIGPENAELRDSLTGLFSQTYFQEALNREIRRAQRSREELSVVYVDIDFFRKLNDTHGQPAGDACLREIAGILRGRCRFSDPQFSLRVPDIAARLEGDRFAILLPDTAKRGAASKGERLRTFVAGHDFSSIDLPPQSVSVGIAAYPEDAPDAPGVLQAAQEAVALAKRQGRNQIVSFQPAFAMSEPADREIVDKETESRAALERCLADQSLFFHYQPIIDIRDETIVAYEALCRTSEPYFKGPMELFASAERAGKVSQLGRVARKANLEILHSLPEPKMLFLNLHPLELNYDLLQEAVDQLGQMARRLVFEITESAAIDDLEMLRTMMEALRGLGFRFALDDLGAGYAGLNSLAILEPDFVKLDMTLVRTARTSSRAAHLVRHMSEYAASQGVQAVAEGVETEEEYKLIKELGCPLVQGYYFARPGPPFPSILKES